MAEGGGGGGGGGGVRLGSIRRGHPDHGNLKQKSEGENTAGLGGGVLVPRRMYAGVSCEEG